MEMNIYKEQMSLGQILSRSWNIFTTHFKTIVQIVLLVYIPINIVLAFVPVGGLLLDSSAREFGAYVRIIQFTEAVFGIIVTMAIAYAVGKISQSQKVHYKEALKEAVHFWPIAIGTGIIETVFILGLILLFIVPGVIYGVYWSFSVFAIVFHQKKFREALKYSKEVVQGRWWRVFGVLIVFGLFSLLAGLVVALPFTFLPDHFVVTIISDTVIDIVTSFFTVATAVFFINLDHVKVRSR